jgi:hypothetical protein
MIEKRTAEEGAVVRAKTRLPPRQNALHVA